LEWFSYHAAQRMTVFRFFFLVIGVLAVGYYQTIADEPILAAGFSALAAFLSILFWRLDLRTRELIKIGEGLLLEMEREFLKWGIVDAQLVTQANSKLSRHATKFFTNWFYSYGQVFSAIFLLIFMFSLVGAICAALKANLIGNIAKVICG
jgi:hypothetical protein